MIHWTSHAYPSHIQPILTIDTQLISHFHEAKKKASCLFSQRIDRKYLSPLSMIRRAPRATKSESRSVERPSGGFRMNHRQMLHVSGVGIDGRFFGDLFHIPFPCLLEILSPVVRWCETLGHLPTPVHGRFTSRLGHLLYVNDCIGQYSSTLWSIWDL